MPEGQKPSNDFPEVDEAVQREFHALRDFLARLEGMTTGTVTPSPVEPIGAAKPTVLHWWIVLHAYEQLSVIAALRERLAAMPGCIAAQIVDLTSQFVRIGLTASSSVTRAQIEFAVLACRDVADAEVILRSPSLVE